ncbi:MAG TPA: HEPN domain-containing protein [Candidatus Nanoarchaeia archaeon]|nr:HEPN domain-containing protein [Candidatus Nanoarchaeia archaeon]
MDLKLYLERAENELILAKAIFTLTQDEKLQKETFEIKSPLTFYSAVISHAYYCIFYSAKAYLLKKGIKVEAPEEHRKTYEEFKKLVLEGIIDVELLKFYEQAMIRAERLLGIIKAEKKKRGDFTYQIIPQANQEPAKESLDNAREFFRHIYNLCE